MVLALPVLFGIMGKHIRLIYDNMSSADRIYINPLICEDSRLYCNIRDVYPPLIRGKRRVQDSLFIFLFH